MSGDIKNRRKDKKRRKDDDDVKEQAPAPPTVLGKFESEDIQMHLQNDHGTGGHWCAKVVFFILMTVLGGLIVLIILENRGMSDVDTPLSESRYSQLFDGWVDESREQHDDHAAHGLEEHEDEEEHEHEILESLNDLDSHEHDQESFPEEPEAQEDESEEDLEPEDAVSIEEENVSAEVNYNEQDVTENVVQSEEIREEVTQHETELPESAEAKDSFENGDEPFEEFEDDGSFEQVVDNDSGEDLHLQKIAEKAQEKVKRAEEPVVQESSTADDQRGAQSFEDDSNDSYLNLELRRAESLLQDKPVSALKQFERILLKHPKSYVALYGKAKALDKLSTVEKSNQLLMEAIDDYKKVLGYGQQLNDTFFIEVAEQCLQRMKFLGQHAKAVGIHEKLIARFNENPDYRNQLAVTYLLMNRLADAKRILHETLLKWRANGYALVHYGFVLKNFDQNLEKAVEFMREGIATNEPGTQDGRFYFHLGDALARLGRKAEAMEVYEVGAKKKLFLSKYQRSLYNVDRLRSQPFWTAEQTMYKQNLDDLRLHWKQIRDEALKILNEDGVFKNEAESLKAAGDWKQFELFARGNRIHKNCARTPFTCALIEKFPAAKNCKRGQVKFSVMIPGTRVWPHCGPTNCRIRAHLGLVVPNGPYITVAEQTRTWKEGEWLIFDDSFEHEVFHNGTSTRLVLIVDVWHPDLTTREQNTLEPI